ncbi:MAG: ABC transporter substrate-binding protein [Limnochordia bacterium]|jgi:ABC-type glycerol-3-phosphate transport system substrate-binding protein
MTRRLRFLGFLGLAVMLLTMVVSWTVLAAPVKVVHVVANHAEPFLNFLNERKEAFEAKHPGVEVEVLYQPADYVTKVQLMIAGGIAVDVLDSTHSFMVFSFADALADLMPYSRGAKLNLDREMLAFAKPVLLKDGQLLGIPSQIYAPVPSYNRTYFDEVGMAPLRSIGDQWSWDWLRANGPRLTRDIDGDGVPDTYGVSFSSAFTRISSAIHQAGGSMFDSYIHPRKALMNTAPVRTGLGFFAELIQRGFGTTQNTATYFGKRQSAIALHIGASDLRYLDDSSDEFEFVAHPKGPVQAGGMIYFGPFHVPAASKQQEWAFRWIAFLALTEESQAKMMEVTGRVPGHPSTLRRLETHMGAYAPHMRNGILQIRDACTHADSYPHTLTEAEGAIGRFFSPAWSNVLRGTTALENFLETMQPLMQAELDKLFMK